MTTQHTVSSDFIIEALENFWDMRGKHQPYWFSDASRSLKEQLFNMIEECGVGEESTPSIIIDNFLINGDFLDRSGDVKFKADEEWQDYCNDNAIIYNEDYACLRF